MKDFPSGLLDSLNDRYGSNPQVVVRFRDRKYGSYDSDDESYSITLPSMEGRLTSLNGLRFNTPSGSNTVVCDITFEICDTSEAILSDVLNAEFSKIDACMVGVACGGSDSIEYIFKGYLSDPIQWNNEQKSFTATFTSDYTKKKIGHVFAGTEVTYPNKRTIGQALPTVFGTVAQVPGMCIQTGCIGYTADEFSFIYDTDKYPAIVPQWLKVSGMNLPGMSPDGTGVDFGGDDLVDTEGVSVGDPAGDPIVSATTGKEYKVYLGGAILTAFFYKAKPNMLWVTHVEMEISQLVTIPKVSLKQYVTDGRAHTMPTIENGGWFVEKQYLGLKIPTDILQWSMWGPVNAVFCGVNFAVNQIVNKIHNFDKWTDAYGKLLKFTKKLIDENPVSEVMYLSPIPPDELMRVSNSVWKLRQVNSSDVALVAPRSEYKEIRAEFKNPIEIDPETKNLRVASSVPILLIGADKKFIPDIYVFNHTQIPASNEVFTGLAQDTDVTAEVPELYYKVARDNNIDVLRSLKQKMFKTGEGLEEVADYKIEKANKVMFGTAVQATIVTLNIPPVLFGSKGVYADVKSNITKNTAEQIRRIVEMNTSFTLSEDAFSETKAAVVAYPSCFMLSDDRSKLGAIKVCSELAYLSNIGLILSSPLIKLKYLATSAATVGSINSDDVIAGTYSIRFTSPQEVTTFFTARWSPTGYGWENESDTFKMFQRIGEPGDEQNQIDLDYYIYNFENNVSKSLKYIALQEGHLWAYLEVVLPMWAAKFDVFDYVDVNLPDITNGKGIIKEVEIYPDTYLVKLTIKMNIVSGD